MNPQRSVEDTTAEAEKFGVVAWHLDGDRYVHPGADIDDVDRGENGQIADYPSLLRVPSQSWVCRSPGAPS